MSTACDDERTPLIARSISGQPLRQALSQSASKLCSPGAWRRRVPITIWLPEYRWSYLLRDIIAGITVGLTSIPQGIAYAIIAGVPPQVGLYSSIFPGVVYAVFGSCNVVTIGPTAILAALLAKYVAVSVDFAYLAAFLSGCVIFLLGILHFGFLLDFISKPVISGFMTAAALQIGATQLKSLFRISGKSGNTFLTAIWNFFKNIATIKLWDTLLGFASIAILILLKRLSTTSSSGSTRQSACTTAILTSIVRARNALVVFGGALLAYLLSLKSMTPFALTGKIEGGLPQFGPPPFSTVVGNVTYNFEDMLSVFGGEGLVMPLVAILESIAIAKAFAGSCRVDVAQEMVAVGLCNVISSFCGSMPVTGSFTRTALNHASGVATPAGSLFKASLVLLAATLMAQTFYFIPRATLAAIIIVAMYHIMEMSVVKSFWNNSKFELFVYIATVLSGVTLGLEYGILFGASSDMVRLLYRAARPTLNVDTKKIGDQECITLELVGSMSYPSAEYVSQRLQTLAPACPAILVLNGKNLQSLDFGVAENIISVIVELEKRGHRVVLWQFVPGVQQLLEGLHPRLAANFTSVHNLEDCLQNFPSEILAVT